MKLVKFDDFFKFANFFCATIGIQPYRNSPERWGKAFLVTVIFNLGALNINCVLASELLYVLLALKNGENFMDVIMTMSNIGFTMVGNFKMLFMYWHKNGLAKYMMSLKKIFPVTPELQLQYNVRHYLKQCSCITMSFSLLYMFLIWTFNLSNIIKLIYDIWVHSEEVGQTLPYIMYIPWNWQKHWSFYLLFISQEFAGYTSAAGHISSDLLLISCATQMVMQYDFIAHKIANYKVQRNVKNVSEEKTNDMDMKFLKNMIQFHSNLLHLSDQLNYVFGIPLLLNFAASSFVICFASFQVTINFTIDNVIKLLLFLASSIFQIYLISYCGQQLIESSTSVAKAVYNQNWYSTSIHFKKMLIFIAQRAQKPAFLKATTFVLISHNTITTIMHLSYKFFTVLRTIYAKE